MDGPNLIQIPSWFGQADSLLKRQLAGLRPQARLLQTHTHSEPLSCQTFWKTDHDAAAVPVLVLGLRA